jgi:predicted dehydrogenase
MIVAAVQTGRMPQVDGAEVTKALRVIAALYQSGPSGTWVTL